MDLKPMSRRQRKSVLEANARLNIWSGAVRSGKTLSSLVRWLVFVANAPEGPLLMVGKTERTLQRNILDLIFEILPSSQYSYNRGLGELSLYGRKIYLVGANDERSEAKIRGITLAGAYGDELTLWPETFFTMLLSRLSVDGAKLFGTTNSDSPLHWLMKRYLDRAEALNLAHFGDFRLEDNPVLGQEYIDALKAEYTGLWYQRFILGKWVLAEGRVYDFFDPGLSAGFVVDQVPDDLSYWTVGVDYGTVNPCAFLLAGFSMSAARWYVVKEYYWDSEKERRMKTDAEYVDDMGEFVGDRLLHALMVDPSAASFKVALRQAREEYPQIVSVRGANNAVFDGIRDTASFLSSGKVKIHRRCSNLVENLQTYSWDPAAVLRGEDKPLKVADHSADAFRYLSAELARMKFC